MNVFKFKWNQYTISALFSRELSLGISVGFLFQQGVYSKERVFAPNNLFPFRAGLYNPDDP